MAFRKWKKILALFIIGWIAVLAYAAWTDFVSRGTETNQLQRAKRVLDKSQLFIDKLQTEITLLRHQVSSLHRNCKKKCPLVKSVKELKDALTEPTNHERSESRTMKLFNRRTESWDKSNRAKNTSMHEYELEAPSLKVEIIRRRASKELREMWYYLSAEVTKINKLLGSSLKARLTAMLDNFAEIHRVLSNNLDKINNHEALSTWRKQEQAKLSKLVQNRLRRLQNPQDCDSARTLLCDLNKGCGYGCQMHHLLYCFITAYGTKRTLIINSYGWRYSDMGWEGMFLPASNTCTVAKGPTTVWSTDSDRSKNVQLPIVDALFPQPKHLPLAVPEDLVEQIQSFHGFPFVWWIGQFAKYLFQYQPEIKKEIDEKKTKLGFKTPIVG
jgi:glycoprotein 6-alpha-L-fucosyltransferase